MRSTTQHVGEVGFQPELGHYSDPPLLVLATLASGSKLFIAIKWPPELHEQALCVLAPQAVASELQWAPVFLLKW